MSIIFLKICLMFLVIFETFCCVSNYRILGVFPVPAKSHYFLGSILMKELAEVGHDVTIIAPFKNEEFRPSLKNGSYKEIILDGFEEAQKKRLSEDGIKLLNDANTISKVLYNYDILFNPLGEECMRHPNVQNLIQSDEKFEVVIVSDFMPRITRVFANHYNASLVLFVNVGSLMWYYDEIGNIVLPSMEPVLNIDMPHRMNFFQRMKNVFDKIQILRWMNSHYLKQNELIKKYFPKASNLEDISKNISLVLVNTHCSTEVVRPMLPNMINIGGFHIKPPKKLPTDLQQIMDKAKNGVIYFSFGTLVNPVYMFSEKMQEIVEMLAKRNETVLWKFDGNLQGKFENIITRNWLPQQEILVHPNLKLFITHGGYLSTLEAIFYGVPTISVPFFGDQIENGRFLEEIGAGISIPLENLRGKTLGDAIDAVISNPKYDEKAKQQSRIMKDRPNRPIDDAIFWVEYVARHKGAKHLRVQYSDLPLYKIYMLDIIGLIFVNTILLVILLLIIIKKLINFTRKLKINGKIAGRHSSKKKN